MHFLMGRLWIATSQSRTTGLAAQNLHLTEILTALRFRHAVYHVTVGAVLLLSSSSFGIVPIPNANSVELFKRPASTSDKKPSKHMGLVS